MHNNQNYSVTCRTLGLHASKLSPLILFLMLSSKWIQYCDFMNLFFCVLLTSSICLFADVPGLSHSPKGPIPLPTRSVNILRSNQHSYLTDSAVWLMNTLRSKPGQQVMALLKLSKRFYQSDSSRAHTYAVQAVTMAQQHADTLTAKALTNLGSFYVEQGNYPRALTYFQQALLKSQRLGRTRDLAYTYRYIANMHHLQSHFGEALTAMQSELNLRRQLKDTAQITALFSNIGHLFEISGSYPTALDYYLRSLTLAEKAHHSEVTAVILMNLGSTYSALNDPKLAAYYSQRATNMFIALKDTNRIITEYSEMSYFGIKNKNLSSSNFYLKKGLALLNLQKTRALPINKAILYELAGQLQTKQNHHTAALGYFNKAERIFRSYNAQDNLVELLNCKALAYQANKQPQVAQIIGRQMLVLARQTHSQSNVEISYKTLADISADNRDFAAAYAYRKRYEVLHDSLFSTQKSQQLAVLQTRYDLRNKESQLRSREAQIALLHHNTALLQSESRLQRRYGLALGVALFLISLLSISWYRRYRFQQAANRQLNARDLEIVAKNHDLVLKQRQLRKSLGEREVLLKEVYHRVKNNLQIIMSLLALQTPDSQLAEGVALQARQGWVRSIALIHELLCQSADLTQIDFERFVNQLTAHLARLSGSSFDVTVTWETPAPGGYLHLDANTAVPLGLIVNELLSNAYKHAFIDGRAGIVHLHLTDRQASGFYTLRVVDNGVGFPPGFNLAQASSLGLQLVFSLAEQLDGTVKIKSSEAGTDCAITFQRVAPALITIQAEEVLS